MRRRTVRGNVSPANATHAATLRAAVILRGRGDRKQHEGEYDSEKVFHFNLLNVFLEGI